MNYEVRWCIDLFDMDSPEDAARQALRIQRDLESTALLFEVRDFKDEQNETLVFVDLLKP